MAERTKEELRQRHSVLEAKDKELRAKFMQAVDSGTASPADMGDLAMALAANWRDIEALFRGD